MPYDAENSTVRIIDKTNNTPTGITEGGLIDGDLLGPEHVARIVREIGDERTPNLTLLLYINTDNQFVKTAPILVDKNAPDKYLIEVQIAQEGNFNELQRYRISSAQVIEDADLGEVLSVQCESIAYEALKESLLSINDELVTPFQRVKNILNFWNGSGGLDKIIFIFTDNDIDIPKSEALKFEYKPTSPRSVHKLIKDVEERIEQAGPLGGVFKNFYYTTEADPTFTKGVRFKMEEFGKDNSGVTIDPDNPDIGGLDRRTALSSNKKRKKIIVVRYAAKSGTLPVEAAEFRSRFTNLSFRTEWDVGVSYLEGDVVKYTDTSEAKHIIRAFQAKLDITGGSNPSINSGGWFEDFTIIPPWSPDAFYTEDEVIQFELLGIINFFISLQDNGPNVTTPDLRPLDWKNILNSRSTSDAAPFFSVSPWTNDLENFKTNLDGTTSPPATYVGVCVDWNFAFALNDIPDFTNRLKTVTGKDVREILNTPPGQGRKRYAGVRYLVGTVPTGDFAGHADQIAERVDDIQQNVLPVWRFSDPPINGDTMYNHDDGFVYGYTTSWNPIYDVVNQSGDPGPVHAVKSIRLVKDASEIPGQAIELQYDWQDAAIGGNNVNKTSRGVWAAFFYPAPILDATVNAGVLYGGDGSGNDIKNPYINHINLNRSSDGSIGWNGKIAESKGRLSQHTIKVKVGFFRSANDDSIESKGKANIKMVYWRKDDTGRFFFHDYEIPENNRWHTLTVSLPPFGPTNLYHSRLDEMFDILNFPVPFDFLIPEKEFSGVKFEFRKNQVWGTFMKDTAYNDIGLYTHYFLDALEVGGEASAQVIGDSVKWIQNIQRILAGEQVDESLFTSLEFAIHHTKITIGELHYNKEGYAIFPETIGDDPRYELVNLINETDYLTAKAKAESGFVKNDFYPNERLVGCGGNVLIRYGQIITEVGDRVPGSPLESVVSNLKETIDNKGFNQELFNIRKFII